MKFPRKFLAAVLALSIALAAPALALTLPSSFVFTDKVPNGPFDGIVIAKTATFYATSGQVSTLDRGTTLTLRGMKNASYAKATYNGTNGYINVKNVMMLVGISARVRTDCWAYEYGGDQKAKLSSGAKVYMVGRYTDQNGTLWLLCTNKSGTALAYIKRANLYR